MTAFAPVTRSTGIDAMCCRIGLAVGVRVVAGGRHALVLRDPALRSRFTGPRLPRMRRRMIGLLAQVLGGPEGYPDTELPAVLAGLGLTRARRDRVTTHLRTALHSTQARGEVIDAVTDALRRLAASAGPV